MHVYEWLACAYFLLLAGAAPWAAAPGRRRAAVAAAAVTLVLGVFASSRLAGATLRQWLPHVYLVWGYWLPALLVPAALVPTAFERWLVRSDETAREILPPVPRVLRPPLELAYLVCYPLVPVSFALVWSAGSGADVSRFWVAVLLSGYASYATLPWLISRPPRLVGAPAREARARPLRTASLNAFVLGRVSHRLNTFPSGHVAVSLAAAAVVWSVLPPAGLAVALVAAAIAVGAAAGRYHYVIDVVLGIAVAALAVALA